MEWQLTQLLHDDRVYSRKLPIQDHDRPHIVYIAVTYHKSFFNDIFDSAPSTFAHTSRLFLSGCHVFNSIQKPNPIYPRIRFLLLSSAIVSYRIKLVLWTGSFAGSPYVSLPSAMLRIKKAIFRASVRMLCKPSASCAASPGAVPWILFQY